MLVLMVVVLLALLLLLVLLLFFALVVSLFHLSLTSAALHFSAIDGCFFEHAPSTSLHWSREALQAASAAAATAAVQDVVSVEVEAEVEVKSAKAVGFTSFAMTPKVS